MLENSGNSMYMPVAPAYNGNSYTNSYAHNMGRSMDMSHEMSGHFPYYPEERRW